MARETQLVTILGSTGSIGQSTLDVIRRNSGSFEIFALTANQSVDVIYQQCLEFNPRYVVLRDEDAAKSLKQRMGHSEIKVLGGSSALVQVASDDVVDIVMAAIVGAAGLESSLAAANSGKRLLLANKESLVMAGALFMSAVKDNDATLLPIDSEHNAIFQSLANGASANALGVKKLLLTSSGGPLLKTPLAEFEAITPAQACAHPNFEMGRKISVDSATMMNKGLELIEAAWLFDTPASKIEIIVHPQQIIHSMVEYIDGSIIAQLGYPDMRTPIAHGLAWPNRIESGVSSLDMVAMAGMQFDKPNSQRFPSLALARAAAEGPDSYAVALNAANEIAVDAFLHELIRFIDIPIIVESVLAKTEDLSISSIDQVLEVDKVARLRAEEVKGQLGRS